MKLEQVPTPAYVIDLGKLEENCRILKQVQEEAGCKVLLAQKAYSLYKTYPSVSYTHLGGPFFLLVLLIENWVLKRKIRFVREHKGVESHG